VVSTTRFRHRGRGLLYRLDRIAAPAAALLVLCFAPAARGAVIVPFGRHIQRLQNLVDSRYGPGHVDVTHDYMGARDTDPDPWFWMGSTIVVRLVKDVTQNGRRDTIGWYEETGVKPAFPGPGIVYVSKTQNGAIAVLPLGRRMRFGFYLKPCPPHDGTNVPGPELLFTNRGYNDVGPDGAGVRHPPDGGDLQALILDVSRWSQPDTWLVCFEDRDSGGDPGPGGLPETDNDFDDMVFEVVALGATPVHAESFGSLKAHYRH